MLVDDLRPEQDPKTEKEPVLEMMHEVVAKRQVVGRGPVPEPEVGGGEDESAGGGAEPRDRAARASQRRMPDRGPGERPTDRERKATPVLRPWRAEDQQRRCHHDQQQVLGHVRPEELAGQRLYRGVEREKDGGEAGPEGDRAPARTGPAPTLSTPASEGGKFSAATPQVKNGGELDAEQDPGFDGPGQRFHGPVRRRGTG